MSGGFRLLWCARHVTRCAHTSAAMPSFRSPVTRSLMMPPFCGCGDHFSPSRYPVALPWAPTLLPCTATSMNTGMLGHIPGDWNSRLLQFWWELCTHSGNRNLWCVKQILSFRLKAHVIISYVFSSHGKHNLLWLRGRIGIGVSFLVLTLGPKSFPS